MEVAEEPVRVQTLAQTGLANVPFPYIQPPENRPALFRERETSDSGIPVIDLFRFGRQELRRACRDWGAFQVTNHGVPLQLLDDMRNSGLSFFNECPMVDKCTYSCDPNSAASEGYGSRMLVNQDTVLDWRDFFDHHTLPVSRRNPNRWPDFIPNYREVVVEYSDHMKALSQRLLRLISESLGLPSLCIEEVVGEVYQNITISYYPPCPQPELTLGLQAHSDMGAITLLIQDSVGGLQVLKDGEWVTVQPLSDAIVVILADQTECYLLPNIMYITNMLTKSISSVLGLASIDNIARKEDYAAGSDLEDVILVDEALCAPEHPGRIITNGEYRSAQHRAITNAHRARLSVATFHDPAKTTIISPAAELVSKSSPPRYRQVVYGDYVSSWYTKGPEGKRNIDALLLHQYQAAEWLWQMDQGACKSLSKEPSEEEFCLALRNEIQRWNFVKIAEIAELQRLQKSTSFFASEGLQISSKLDWTDGHICA
ncbi:hypothetical protein HHK36_023126 [Tetracentron sinense]|uniref:Fe2OG dioxygenase domain-containing protein n=1 Tax=Tetracentron sinense TaxID=13715 RepID=A0A835D7M4_TETSI|nr:hypothetical protein HHK36_023126 [Tetracentron sinense]